MIALLLVLLSFFPLASTSGYLELAITSPTAQWITVKIETENGFHGFKSLLTPEKEELFHHEASNLSGQLNYTFRTEQSPIIVTEMLAVGEGNLEFEEATLFTLGLNEMKIRVVCNRNWFGEKCDKYCDEQVAEADGYLCDREHKKVEQLDEGCSDKISCEYQRAITKCTQEMMWTKTRCMLIVKTAKSLRELVEKFSE